MSKFIYSFGVIFSGLALGVVIQFLNRSSRLRLPLPIDDLRKLLQKVALLGLNPIAIVGAIWIVRIRDAKLIALQVKGTQKKRHFPANGRDIHYGAALDCSEMGQNRTGDIQQSDYIGIKLTNDIFSGKSFKRSIGAITGIVD